MSGRRLAFLWQVVRASCLLKVHFTSVGVGKRFGVFLVYSGVHLLRL